MDITVQNFGFPTPRSIILIVSSETSAISASLSLKIFSLDILIQIIEQPTALDIMWRWVVVKYFKIKTILDFVLVFRC